MATCIQSEHQMVPDFKRIIKYIYRHAERERKGWKGRISVDKEVLPDLLPYIFLWIPISSVANICGQSLGIKESITGATQMYVRSYLIS